VEDLYIEYCDTIACIAQAGALKIAKHPTHLDQATQQNEVHNLPAYYAIEFFYSTAIFGKFRQYNYK
jgi:hypothetical protein